ncbi:hypothetical protein BGZ76_010125 [Entomortierella beljakovae]|nr:hypothetical protein BGZ76_010125 [Entomortierella beljakovae]
MYLAYLRCSAVFPAFQKVDWLHYSLFAFRAIELLAIVVINIIQNHLCNGSVAPETQCAKYAIAWTFRDAGAPVFRIYYIICEAIFYVKLFKTLKGMNPGKNPQLVQYRRLQTTLFTVDLALLVFMSIYRIIGIFDKNLPTYVYYELFSSTLTIFNLTEFGLNIRILFHTITEAKTSSDPASSGPNKMEMGLMNRNQNQSGALASSTLVSSNRFLDDPFGERDKHRHDSSSPLTSFPGETGYSDYDLSAPDTAISSPYISSQSRSIPGDDHDDHVPYNASSSSSASQSFSPRVSALQHDQYIIAPSNFQTQAQTGFNEASENFVAPSLLPVSRPIRALVSPERTTRRKTDDTLQG